MNKKYMTVIFTLFILWTIFPQNPPTLPVSSNDSEIVGEFEKTVDYKKRLGVLESSCVDGCTEISPGLSYKLRKIVNFRLPDGVKYEIEFTVKDKNLIFRRTLNTDLKIIIELVKGNSLEKVSTEDTGFFRGTFTVATNDSEIMRGLGIKHVVLKGELKTVIFCVSDDDSFKLLENIKKLQDEGFE